MKGSFLVQCMFGESHHCGIDLIYDDLGGMDKFVTWVRGQDRVIELYNDNMASYLWVTIRIHTSNTKDIAFKIHDTSDEYVPVVSCSEIEFDGIEVFVPEGMSQKRGYVMNHEPYMTMSLYASVSKYVQRGFVITHDQFQFSCSLDLDHARTCDDSPTGRRIRLMLLDFVEQVSISHPLYERRVVHLICVMAKIFPVMITDVPIMWSEQ